MLSGQVHLIVSALLAVAGLAAVVFGVMRGRSVGARAPFILGGLALVLYAGAFLFVQKVARFVDIAAVAEVTGQANDDTRFVRRVERASFPVAAIEPVAVLLLALGFGALARASDARTSSALPQDAPPAPAPDAAEGAGDAFAEDLLEGEPVGGDESDGDVFDADAEPEA